MATHCNRPMPIAQQLQIPIDHCIQLKLWHFSWLVTFSQADSINTYKGINKIKEENAHGMTQGEKCRGVLNISDLH